MKIERIVCQTGRYTFGNKRIMKLVKQEMTNSVWIDPMAGKYSPCQITNDIDPNMPTRYHEDALDFLKRQPSESYDGCIFDPPFSPYLSERLYKKKYKGATGTTGMWHYIYDCRVEIARILKPNGKVIMFGYTSMGMPKRFGFKYERIVYFCQLGFHNEVCMVVQRKVQTTLK